MLIECHDDECRRAADVEGGFAIKRTETQTVNIVDSLYLAGSQRTQVRKVLETLRRSDPHEIPDLAITGG